MPVPRTRKKMEPSTQGTSTAKKSTSKKTSTRKTVARSAEKTTAKTATPSKKSTQAAPKTAATPTERQVKKNVEKAFKVMEGLEKTIPQSEAKSSSQTSLTTSQKSGFRVHFSIDANIPEGESSSQNIDSSRMVECDFTLPFFWRFPILGTIIKRFVRNVHITV